MELIRKKLQDKLVELVEERFPKGNKERGNATVMMALFFAEVMKELENYGKN